MVGVGGLSVSLGELGESVAESGSITSVRDVLDMLGSGHELLWVGLSMVQEWYFVVNIGLMWVVHWGNSVRSFVNVGSIENAVLLSLKKLHEFSMHGKVIVSLSRLQKSKSKQDK